MDWVRIVHPVFIALVFDWLDHPLALLQPVMAGLHGPGGDHGPTR